MKTTTFENAKVGDKVWSVQYGWVYIEYVGDNAYPIRVKLNSGLTTSFTLCGRQFKGDVSQTLFWDEVLFEAPSKPLPKLNVDDKVLVWGGGCESKYKRYFSHFIGDKIYCFDKGATSFSANKDGTTAWDNFEIYTGDNK